MSETLPKAEARAVGVVTAHKSRRTYSGIDNRPEVLFFPSVRFQTADGRSVEFENDLGSNAPPRVGDEVTVLYDPLRPEEAQIKSVMMLWFLPGMFVAVGLPSLVFGALGLLVLIVVSLVLLF